MRYTFDTTEKHDLGVTAAVDRVNNARPLDEKGQPIGEAVTAADYVAARLEDVFNSWHLQAVHDQAELLRQQYVSAQTATEPTSDLETARAAKLAEINAGYQAQIAAGITPQGTDFILAATERDVAKFSQLATLLREIEELQPSDEAKAAVRKSPTTIADIDGKTHTMTIEEVRGVIVNYGMQWNAGWTAFTTQKAQLAQATTIEQIAAIV